MRKVPNPNLENENCLPGLHGISNAVSRGRHRHPDRYYGNPRLSPARAEAEAESGRSCGADASGAVAVSAVEAGRGRPEKPMAETSRHDAPIERGVPTAPTESARSRSNPVGIRRGCRGPGCLLRFLRWQRPLPRSVELDSANCGWTLNGALARGFAT
jgi:hypothetical protein